MTMQEYYAVFHHGNYACVSIRIQWSALKLDPDVHDSNALFESALSTASMCILPGWLDEATIVEVGEVGVGGGA